MFGRTKKEAPEASSPTAGTTTRAGGKGRPTPSRREAEAAARARAKGTADKKAMREKRSVSSAEIRAGMKRGDERFLPPRDRGPVKRYLRNWVDARLSIAEFVLPVLIVIMALLYSRQPALTSFGQTLWAITLLVVFVDVGFMLWRLRRALRAEFPDESLRGTTFYAVMRVLQIRPLRMPKPQVRVGGRPK